jgi:hypothetical protein
LKQKIHLLGQYCSYERNFAKTGVESSLQAISISAAFAGRQFGQTCLRRADGR